MKLNASAQLAMRYVCPLIKNPPNTDCYCIKMDSVSVQSIIHYCANNYEECNIFKEYNKKAT